MEALGSVKRGMKERPLSVNEKVKDVSVNIIYVYT